jgi:multidrug efflux pump
MIENISRYIEEGLPPFEAALRGARQIGFTILSLTVSLVAVLIPLLFMGGLIGRLFREFAVTLAVAIGVSALLSLTLTPMMCAHLLRGHEESKPSAFFQASERIFDWMIEVYDTGLRWVLRHRTITLLSTFATVALTAWLALIVPKGFFPLQDTGAILGVTEASADVSFARMTTLQRSLVDAIRKDPDVAEVASFIGADGSNPTVSQGRLNVMLKPRADRKSDVSAVIARLSKAASGVEGITLHMQAAQDLSIDSRVSRTQYAYTLEDADPEELRAYVPRLVEALAAHPEVEDVATDQESEALASALDVDRDTAARLGVTQQVVDDTLYDAFGQRQISTIFTQLNQYRVILEVPPKDRESPEALGRIYARSSSGDAVPLSAFAHWGHARVAPTIGHQGQFPAVVLSFNTAPGVSLGEAVLAIQRAEEEIGRPPGVHAEFQGAAQAFQESLDSEPLLILAALITVYIVLGVLYESTIHPITILSTLPSAGVGALLALLLTRVEFSVIALIGIILLIGIVKKNAIMMIDFALEAERQRGLTPEQSIHEACLLRFRPIMMTTMAALLGGLPLALGNGTGSELRRPLGIAIVGGLVLSQVLTLYTTPVIYLAMERVKRFFGGAAPLRAAEESASP